MSSSRKKAIVRKFTREWVAGYLSPDRFVHEARLEMLDLAGKITTLDLEEIKWVCFVRDFNSGEADNPERLVRKTFAGRPRSEGIFLRLKLTDGDVVEGLAANDLTLALGDGLFLIPPDTRSNTQRMWIPRSSLAELEIVAVIGSAAKKKTSAAISRPDTQESLFG
jgi:hypothetical protein